MHSPASHSDLVLASVTAAIAMVLIAGGLLGGLARRLRQPPVIGEIAAGIVLGPSVLGLLPGDLTEHLFPAAIRPMLSSISQVGLLLFLFVIGWEFEKTLLRDRRAAAVTISLFSVALSFALGAGLAVVLYSGHAEVGGKRISELAFALFLGAAMSVTAFPVLSRILTDNKLLHTRVGALALASAAVDDVLAWCMLAVVSAVVTAGDQSDLVQISLLSAAYVLGMFAVVRPLLRWLVGRLRPGRSSAWLLPVLAAGVFLSAYATTWIGIHAIFGAFLFGWITPREPAETLERELRRPLEAVSTILLPVFFIVAGLGVELGSLSGRNLLELTAIIVVACAGKLVGTTAPAWAFGLPRREIGALGLLLNTRGLTELIILNAGVSLGVLDTQMYTMMVIMALLTTAATGPLLPDRALLGAPARPAAPAAPGSPAGETTSDRDRERSVS